MRSGKTDIVVLAAVALLAVVVVGELSAYAFHPNSYSADAEWVGGDFEYSVTSNGSDGYTVISMTGSSEVEELVIYIDGDFDDNLEDAREICEVLGFDQGEMADQLTKQLSMRGFTGVSEADADGLYDFVNSSISDASGKGIFVAGYALPSSVYSGNASDPIFQWISNGGRLYWAASEIGRFYTDASGVHEVTGNQELFFGVSDCIYGGEDRATDVDGSDFCELFCLQNNRMEHAVSTSVPGTLSIGYIHEGYASISLTGMGSGCICVFSGDLPIRETEDMAQVIAAGLTDGTSIVNSTSGEVKGTREGTLEGAADSVYLFIGGVNTVFGRAFYA